LFSTKKPELQEGGDPRPCLIAAIAFPGQEINLKSRTIPVLQDIPPQCLAYFLTVNRQPPVRPCPTFAMAF
jgi:hypothetical protein